jgi:alanyl-tRNA synthetase
MTSSTTVRLYEERPLAADDDGRFRARVVEVAPRDGGARVTLDRTLFYPTGGGQPCDLGALGRGKVVDVLEEGERIVHDVDGPAPAVGEEVDGAIDVARRRDHMAHHSGQHLLSGVLARRHGIPTVSFHLGREAATIDVARSSLEPWRMAQVEAEVNAEIRASAPVSTRVLRDAEARAAAPGLRKAPIAEALASPRGLRVVQLGRDPEPLDRDACCGTHVASTGEIGLLVLLGAEKGKKGETRVTFVCGARAVAAVRARLDALERASRATAAGFSELPARVEGLIEDAKSMKKALSAARGELLRRDGEALAQAAVRAATGAVLTHRLEGGDAGDARTLARAIVDAAPRLRCAVVQVVGTDAALVTACGPEAAGDAAKALQAALAGKGRGGGNAAMAQGAVPDPKQADALLAAAAQALA